MRIISFLGFYRPSVKCLHILVSLKRLKQQIYPLLSTAT